jgi:hypothetical protein
MVLPMSLQAEAAEAAVAHQVAEAEADLLAAAVQQSKHCTNIYLNYLNKQSMKKIPMVNKSQQQ